VFLNGAPVAQKSRQQKSVTLSSAEAELASGTQCAQDMLYVMQIMESIGLPMILEINNKVAVGLANNWSIVGWTWYVQVCQYFLRELKEDGIIHTKWLSGNQMSSNLFMKNLARPLFELHRCAFIEQDKYMHITQDG
jgi:hypothetical protein